MHRLVHWNENKLLAVGIGNIMYILRFEDYKEGSPIAIEICKPNFTITALRWLEVKKVVVQKIVALGTTDPDKKLIIYDVDIKKVVRVIN